MGLLTTHVLDTARGTPAVAMPLTLYRRHGDAWEPVGRWVTDGDGRCATPLLDAGSMRTGLYRIEFEAGTFFRAQGAPVADPPFLDRIPIDFAIADVAAHYHVPLLVSPWSYSTYRGS